MKTINNFAALAALGLLSLNTAAHAQTLTLNAPITGISHEGPGVVRDTLTITPATYNLDLSQYTAFAFHYTAPAGQQIVVNAGRSVNFGANSYLFQNPNTPYNGASATVAVAFDNLQGSVGSFSSDAGLAPLNGFTVDAFADVPGSVSFTGFTVTVSDFANLPSGLATYTNGSYGNSFYYFDFSSSNDPGAFTSLQAIPAAATPEPGSVALLVGMGVSGIAVLRRRRK